jgi:hypothetical protein
MQLHCRERVPQHQLQPFRHVALAVERTLRVIPHIRALKQPANDLAEREDAGDRAILDPAHEEALHIRLPAPHHPFGESAGIRRRGHPAAMQCPAGSIPGYDLRLVMLAWLAQEDSFTHLEGMGEIRPAHVEPSFAAPR